MTVMGLVHLPDDGLPFARVCLCSLVSINPVALWRADAVVQPSVQLHERGLVLFACSAGVSCSAACTMFYAVQNGWNNFDWALLALWALWSIIDSIELIRATGREYLLGSCACLPFSPQWPLGSPRCVINVIGTVADLPAGPGETSIHGRPHSV